MHVTIMDNLAYIYQYMPVSAKEHYVPRTSLCLSDPEIKLSMNIIFIKNTTQYT